MPGVSVSSTFCSSPVVGVKDCNAATGAESLVEEDPMLPPEK